MFHRNSMFRMFALALCVFAFVGMVMVGTSTTAFCAGADSITTAANNLATKAYTIARSVIVPIAICALAFAGFQFLIGGTQGSEKARKVVIGCVCAIAFVVFAPMVVQTVGGFVKDEGKGDLSGYNDLD